MNEKQDITPAPRSGACDTPPSTALERWKRLYEAPGGPLVGWLVEEADARGLDLSGLAQALGVTTGYICQLRNGMRDSATVSREFAASSALFLGVPAVVIMIIAGQLQLVDCVCASEFERWAQSLADVDNSDPVHLVGGARVCPEELRLMPTIVQALRGAAYVHAARARLVPAR